MDVYPYILNMQEELCPATFLLGMLYWGNRQKENQIHGCAHVEQTKWMDAHTSEFRASEKMTEEEREEERGESESEREWKEESK